MTHHTLGILLLSTAMLTGCGREESTSSSTNNAAERAATDASIKAAEAARVAADAKVAANLKAADDARAAADRAANDTKKAADAKIAADIESAAAVKSAADRAAADTKSAADAKIAADTKAASDRATIDARIAAEKNIERDTISTGAANNIVGSTNNAKATLLLTQLAEQTHNDKFVLARTTLNQLEAMKASLPESVQKQIDSARTALNAKSNDGDMDNLKTTADQSQSAANIKITADIRRAIMEDSSMSMNAQNCKIITDESGRVTLRGVVENQAEKDSVQTKAVAVAGVSKVDNQLEIKAN